MASRQADIGIDIDIDIARRRRRKSLAVSDIGVSDVVVGRDRLDWMTEMDSAYREWGATTGTTATTLGQHLTLAPGHYRSVDSPGPIIRRTDSACLPACLLGRREVTFGHEQSN